MQSTPATAHTLTVALPVWEGRLSPVLDVARQLLVVRLEAGAEAGRHLCHVHGLAPRRWPALLSDLGVDVLICGAVSDALSAALTRGGTSLMPWVQGEIDAVLRAYLSGELDDPRFAVPGALPKADPR
ncbi:MAG: hypothetical protein ABIL09_23465 [Gemmatimonadota bacterium]